MRCGRRDGIIPGIVTPSSFRRVRPALGPFAVTSLHVFALWAFAVAVPVYSLLGSNPELFVAYRADRADILALMGLVSFVVPALALGAIGLIALISTGAARLALAAFAGVLLAGVAANATRLSGLPTVLHIAILVTVVIGSAVLYVRAAPFGSFLFWLSPVAIAAPLLFVLHPAVRPFVRPAYEQVRPEGDVQGDTPVVVVVFDQLPLSSLINLDGGLDSEAFPGFTALARTSTWFRNATTVADYTGWALPPIVTGKYPSPDRLPLAESYPQNLFTLLTRTHVMRVFEPITGLCPSSLCVDDDDRGMANVLFMAADAAVVFLHALTPPAFEFALPSVTDNWRGFIDAQRWQRRWAQEYRRDRRRNLELFLDGMRRGTARSTLHFLHLVLPHEPYVYFPGGFESPDPGQVLSDGRWPDQDWPVLQSYQRHLLQLRVVDAALARILDRLRQEGLFDAALVVVTSDHGVSFMPGHPMKGLTEVTARDIAPVPLFIKRPYQHTGVIDDRAVQTIDILPTVIDLLGGKLTQPTDGRPITSAARFSDRQPVLFYDDARNKLVLTPSMLEARRQAAERRAKWFGPTSGPPWRSLLSPVPALRGRRVEELPQIREPNLQIRVEDAHEFAAVNLAGKYVPAAISGRVRGDEARRQQLVLAISVNGRIEATTSTYFSARGAINGTWDALIHPGVFREGRNDLAVFVVREHNGRLMLAPGFRSAADGS